MYELKGVRAPHSRLLFVGFGDTDNFDFTISNVISEVCLWGHHLGRAGPTLESLPPSQNSFHDSALQSLSKGRESFADTLAKGRDALKKSRESFTEGLNRSFRLASNSDVSDGADDLDKAVQAKPVVEEGTDGLDELRGSLRQRSAILHTAKKFSIFFVFFLFIFFILFAFYSVEWVSARHMWLTSRQS